MTTVPPLPTDPGFMDWLVWGGNVLIWIVMDPTVRGIAVAILIPLIAQVCAITFGEVMKMSPKFMAMRVGDRKWWLRFMPILVGAICTFVMLYDYYDLAWSSAGSWILLSLLNGAAAWPVFDRVVEPYILPWAYTKMAKMTGIKPKDVPADTGNAPPDTGNTVINAIATLKRKGLLDTPSEKKDV